MRHYIPALSLIVIAYNEEEYIGSCMEAIQQQTFPPDEVIVVNNNSTDKTAEIAKTFPFVTLINETEQGMIPARDAGFNAAKGDLLARIDADTRIPIDWVEKVHRILDNRAQDIVGVSGPQYFYAVQDSTLRKITSDITSRYGFFAVSKIMLGHETLFGSNMVITKHAWQKVKNDVCHDSYKVHEDVDLALHISQYGIILFDRDLIAGISTRAFLENTKKHVWRLKTWVKSVTHHRKLFVGPNR
ncbi:MAG: glycosyltransferase family 2 protein [Candidatus Levyibacteriota bacterium]